MLWLSLALARTYALAPSWEPGMSLEEARERCRAISGELAVAEPNIDWHHPSSLPSVHCLGAAPTNRSYRVMGSLCGDELCLVRQDGLGFEAMHTALSSALGPSSTEGGYPDAGSTTGGCLPTPTELRVWEPLEWPDGGIAVHLRRSGHYSGGSERTVVWADHYTLVLATPAVMRDLIRWRQRRDERNEEHHTPELVNLDDLME